MSVTSSAILGLLIYTLTALWSLFTKKLVENVIFEKLDPFSYILQNTTLRYLNLNKIDSSGSEKLIAVYLCTLRLNLRNLLKTFHNAFFIKLAMSFFK